MNLDLVQSLWWQISLAVIGLVFMLMPAGRRMNGKYRVVEPAGAFAAGGCGLKFIGLALLGFAGWRLYLDYWLVYHPRFSKDPAEWHPVQTTDGVISARFPVSAVKSQDASVAAWTGEAGKGFHVAVVERIVPPGSGFLTAPDLVAFYHGVAATPPDANLALAQVIRQEAMRTGSTSGARLGLDLAGGLRMFVQNYRVADRLFAVSMCAPVTFFEDGTAKRFFDTITVTPPTQPITPSPSIGGKRPTIGGTSSPTGGAKEPERRFGPKPGVKGLRD